MIVQSSSLLLMIKPLQSSNGKLHCNIIGMLGRRYIGWLDVELGIDGLTYLIWRQAKPTIDNSFGDLPSSPRLTLSVETTSSYNLKSFTTGSVVHSELYGGSHQILTGLNFNILNMSNSELDAYLSTRENRSQVNTCDLQFNYISSLC